MTHTPIDPATPDEETYVHPDPCPICQVRAILRAWRRSKGMTFPEDEGAGNLSEAPENPLE
jgi:hypothetical protein